MTPCRANYQRWFEAIEANPGLSLYHLTQLMRTSHNRTVSVLAHMEYFGFLLYEDDNKVYALKSVERQPGDLGEITLGKNARWRRTGTTLVRDAAYDDDYYGGESRRKRLRETSAKYQAKVNNGEIEDYQRSGFAKDIYGFARRRERD